MFKRLFIIILFSALIYANTKGEEMPSKNSAVSKHPVVVLSTNKGDIELELYPDKAPITVQNFLDYVNAGFYNGTIFHRVIKNFMIQGGGFEPGLKQKKTREPIKNEAANGLSNERGTVAMARTMVVDSATAQFFINVVDNPFLDHRDASDQGFGYCVFGKVISGLETVDKIKEVETAASGYYQDVPVKDIIIVSANIKN